MNVSIIADIVRDIDYFKQVAENSGVKTLYEYSKYSELSHISANLPVNNSDTYYIVFCGRVQCRNKEAVLRDYTDGEEIGQISSELEYVTKEASYLITLKMTALRRLNSLEQGCFANQNKKF